MGASKDRKKAIHFDGAKLRRERESRDLSLMKLAVELSKLMGLKPIDYVVYQSIQHWELGDNEPSFSHVLALCQFFRCDIFFWQKKA